MRGRWWAHGCARAQPAPHTLTNGSQPSNSGTRLQHCASLTSPPALLQCVASWLAPVSWLAFNRSPVLAPPPLLQWGGEVLGSVSHAIFRFTEEQDLRLTAGVRAPLTEAGLGEAQPFLRLQENCWGITFDRHGSWRVTYDL